MTSQNQNRNGIDIRDALSILSLRAKAGGEKELKGRVNLDKRGMGQTIDLFQSDAKSWTNLSNSGGCPCAATIPKEMEETPKLNESKEEEEKRIKMQEERVEREQRIKNELKNLSVKDLLNAILGVQKERVVAYKEFDA